jgi:hypothetical protein
VTAKLEDIPKNKVHISANDNGDNPLIYETGTDKNLTPNEVQGRGATYDQLTYSDPSLVGYWPFEEGTGTTTKDLSGNGNDGTIYGATWTTGKVVSALSFDGVDDYVDVSAIGVSRILDVVPVSLEAWINERVRSSNDFRNNYISSDRPSYYGQGFGIGSDGKLKIEYHNGFWQPNILIPLNIWQHIILVYTPGNVKVYINGEYKNKLNYTQATPDGITGVSIGRHNSGIGEAYYINGLIDEVRIYNRALSDVEIKAFYDATK